MVNKIVITGGFGFIGAKMVNHFKSKNIEVVVLEHPESRTPKNYPKLPFDYPKLHSIVQNYLK